MMVVEESALSAALKIRHGGREDGGNDQTGQADRQVIPDEFGVTRSRVFGTADPGCRDSRQKAERQ